MAQAIGKRPRPQAITAWSGWIDQKNGGFFQFYMVILSQFHLHFYMVILLFGILNGFYKSMIFQVDWSFPSTSYSVVNSTVRCQGFAYSQLPLEESQSKARARIAKTIVRMVKAGYGPNTEKNWKESNHLPSSNGYQVSKIVEWEMNMATGCYRSKLITLIIHWMA